MKPLNQSIVSRSFILAALKMVTQSLRKGDILVSLDLSDAYFHVPVACDDCRFLQFKIKHQIFQFWAMPFGLSSPRVSSLRLCSP